MAVMDKHIFMAQIGRLGDLFGAKHYNADRIAVIWREVQDLGNDWMVRTTDQFVGNHRLAPLMPEFREEVSKERERLWQIKKRQHVEDAKVFSGWFCSLCANEGMLTNENNEWLRCSCEHGARRPQSWPQLPKEHLRVLKS